MIQKVLCLMMIFLPSWGSAQNNPGVIDPFAMRLAAIEQKHNIPNGLLSAISKVESGRYHQKHRKVIPWPWVIHAQGEGRFFSTKQEAINAVHALKAKGIKNIDVGLMQVNLLHHPQAFSSLEEAFNPEKNIEYAAKYLSDLKKEHASWSKAVAHYHSALPEYHVPYRHKVYKMWQKERKNGFSRWIEQDYFRSGAAEGNSWYHSPSPRFKIIRVRPLHHPSSSPQEALQKTAFDAKENKNSKPKPIPIKLSRLSTHNALRSSSHLQNRFRFIKSYKMRSFQLAQKTAKNEKGR
jgi:hypothetical protein